MREGEGERIGGGEEDRGGEGERIGGGGEGERIGGGGKRGEGEERVWLP